MKKIFFIGFVSLLFLQGYGAELYLHIPQNDSSNYTSVATIDVLIIIYTNTAGAKISAAEIKRIKNGLDLAREFYWRNSGCQLNLNLSYLEIAEFKPRSFFPRNGLLWPQYVEQDFKNHQINANQYGIIVLIYAPPGGGGNYGGMKLLGETGYSFFRYPFKTSVLYPGKEDSVDYKCTWLFTHELQHSVDLICYEKSGAPAMWHGDQPLDYAIQAGEQFSYQAEILRNFKDYLKIKRPYGYILQVVDQDGDKFPDNDPRLPCDEHRFGSDSTKTDSDFDGLNDLEEYRAGIYASSAPRRRDTDFDGIPDGDDPYPRYSIIPEIPYLTPDFHGDLSDWYLITDQVEFYSGSSESGSGFSAKIYMNWDDNYLYFASVTNSPAELHLDLDLTNDGWWNGKDNCRIVGDPFSERFSEIRIMDTTTKARKLRLKHGRGFFEMWDDEPEYISRFGRLIDEFAVKLGTSVSETEFTIKIAIPKNDKIGFKLEPEAQLGIRIFYSKIEGSDWATVFEQYSFIDFILKAQ